MVRPELASHVAGTADGQQILASLQIHILFEGGHVDLSRPRQSDADLLVHGVRSRDSGSLHGLKRIGKNRVLNIGVKLHL